MTTDLLSRDFRTFKHKSELVMPDMTKEEMQRVKLALECLAYAFEKQIAAKPPRRRAAP